MSAPLLPVLLVAAVASAAPAAPGAGPSKYLELAERFPNRASCVRFEAALRASLDGLLERNGLRLTTSCTME